MNWPLVVQEVMKSFHKGNGDHRLDWDPLLHFATLPGRSESYWISEGTERQYRSNVQTWHNYCRCLTDINQRRLSENQLANRNGNDPPEHQTEGWPNPPRWLSKFPWVLANHALSLMFWGRPWHTAFHSVGQGYATIVLLLQLLIFIEEVAWLVHQTTIHHFCNFHLTTPCQGKRILTGNKEDAYLLNSKQWPRNKSS